MLGAAHGPAHARDARGQSAKQVRRRPREGVGGSGVVCSSNVARSAYCFIGVGWLLRGGQAVRPSTWRCSLCSASPPSTSLRRGGSNDVGLPGSAIRSPETRASWADVYGMGSNIPDEAQNVTKLEMSAILLHTVFANN